MSVKGLNSSHTRYDKHGVPEYSAQDLENKAEEVLSFFCKEKLRTHGATPFRDIAERLNKDFKIGIDFDTDLGSTTSGNYKIIGKFVFKPRGIMIDRSLQSDKERFNFTFAHEIGHLVLHRNLKLPEGYDADEISDTERDLITGKKILSTARDWLEWQANRFAASVLMPRATIGNAVIEKQKELGIKRNIGFIYLDNNTFNIKDYQDIVKHLQYVYQASKSSIKYRLIGLNILIDKRGQDISHISELLKV